MLLQHVQLQGHFLQFLLHVGAAHQAGAGGEFQPVAGQGAAADRHPQFGVAGAVDPADRGGVMAPFKRLQAAQGRHRFAAGQAGHGRGGVQGGGQGQGVVVA